MEKDFWLERWESNKIGFHQGDFNVYLTKYWDTFIRNTGDVLVPLCGKSKDMIYLAKCGHKVIGVELSKIAVEAFFKENNIDYDIINEDEFEIFRSEGISIYCGDILNMTMESLRNIKYIYDRASMVALPVSIREKYITLIESKISQADIFIQTVSFDDSKLGPPFSLDQKWVETNFKTNYIIHQLETERFEDENVQVHSGKVSFSQNNIFKLTRI